MVRGAAGGELGQVAELISKSLNAGGLHTPHDLPLPPFFLHFCAIMGAFAQKTLTHFHMLGSLYHIQVFSLLGRSLNPSQKQSCHQKH